MDSCNVIGSRPQSSIISLPESIDVLVYCCSCKADEEKKWKEKENEKSIPNSGWADLQASRASPDLLSADLSSSVGSIDEVALLDKDTNMLDTRFAVSAFSPEQKITLLGTCALDMLAFLVLVLLLGGMRKLYLSASGFADGVERETRAVESASSLAGAVSATKDILHTELLLCVIVDGISLVGTGFDLAGEELDLFLCWLGLGISIGISIGISFCLSFSISFRLSIGFGLGFSVADCKSCLLGKDTSIGLFARCTNVTDFKGLIDRGGNIALIKRYS